MDETTIAGRYRLGEVLGRGGMGTVRRAHDERLGRDVAIKTVDLSEAHDATVGDRFTREAQVTASLAHPNIVTVHDFGVEGETGYLVMELLSDPTLADLLRERGTLTVPQAADVARQVAEALAAAHARGVVHRDVKPSNIVVGPTGRVRVLDFGITRIVDEATSTQLTAAQEVVGSPDYMSPEHARGEAVDARSDIYALGCVAYQMVAGEPPLNGATSMATLLRQVNDEPTPLTEVAPGTPAWYSDLVDALLAKDPADRPADASAVVARLREGVRGASVPLVADAAPTERLDAADSTRVMPAARQPVRPAAPVPAAPAPAPVPVRRPVPPARRGSALPWVVGLLLLATLAALAWFLLADRDDEPRSPVTTTRTRTTTPSSSTPPATSQQSSSTTPPTQTTTQAPPSTSTPTSSSTPPPTTTPPTTPSAPPTSAPPTSTSAPTSTPAPSTSAPAAPPAETAPPSS